MNVYKPANLNMQGTNFLFKLYKCLNEAAQNMRKSIFEILLELTVFELTVVYISDPTLFSFTFWQMNPPVICITDRHLCNEFYSTYSKIFEGILNSWPNIDLLSS